MSTPDTPRSAVVVTPTAAGGVIRRTRWRNPAVYGAAVGLAIMLTATVSTGIMTAIVRRVLLEDLRNYLQRSAETTAALIDRERHALMIDSVQTASVEYLALARPLITLLRSNPDIRFAYTGRMRGDSMSYVLDGDTTRDRAYVGERDVPTAGELKIGRTHRTVVEDSPSPSAWGTGIRAYAPIRVMPDGAIIYAGVTMDAARYEAWLRRVYQGTALGLAVALVLATLGAARAARAEHRRMASEEEIARSREREDAAAAERRGLVLRLERRQRTEALGTLAGGVAHDFNNLLSVILGNAELILQDESADSSTGESAVAIRTAATRARDVARQILVFANPRSEGHKAIALASLVEETVQMLASSLPSSISLRWTPPLQEVWAKADASQITQILMNLGVNASQALPDRRGTIAFSVDRVEVKGREADRLALAPGHYARLIVRDDGVGMSEEVGARIFEPFFTTKKVGDGTGLNLSVVDGVVRGHLGAIDLQTRPGKGSTFRVYLPAGRKEAPSVPSARSATPAVRRGEGRRLLLLDDDTAVLQTTARMLRRAGFEVDALEDADAALAALDQPRHPYVGLITDRTMPSLSGLEVARRAHALDPLLPIILLSGAPQPGDAESSGITVVLGKPHNTRTLLDALERAEVGHSRTSSGATP